MSRITQRDFDELLADLTRFVPTQVTEVWDAAGSEVQRAAARLWAVLEDRIADLYNSRYVLLATGPVRATGTQRWVFANAIADAFTIKAGSIVRATPWGVRYRLAADVAVTAPQSPGYEVDVELEAVHPGLEQNVDVQHLTEWPFADYVTPEDALDWSAATTAAGMAQFVDEVIAGGIANDDDNSTGMTGGKLATLDLIAKGRGRPRADGEGDPQLQVRVRERRREAVTPNGILASVTRQLYPHGVTPVLVEPWDYGWTIGDEDAGEIGAYGPARLRQYIVFVPELGTSVEGWAVGDTGTGEIGEDPIGLGDTDGAAILAAVAEHLDRISADGISSLVFEGSPP